MSRAPYNARYRHDAPRAIFANTLGELSSVLVHQKSALLKILWQEMILFQRQMRRSSLLIDASDRRR